ncbi:hypothetical protein CAL12_27295 [Bordetella genomosp. 8]|uniref:Uncharacterized protein n=1 Tax=Bordetella genomosp. 8 TaxID=1416806 RepID=A0A1W6YST4_9BORD|nr:glucosyltransferase domain-containing protein [Bordetella genomosp. 8]ARP84152.1 hypothetical protein CAL12_27295 [Bordetella genomosp. 8]
MHPTAPSPSRQKAFIAASLLYGLAMYPILHADRFYIDDLGRARSGYLGWTTDGRPLSNLVVETLNLGAPISDLSPLPQLLAVLLLAWLAVTLARKFAIPGTWRAPLILAPLVINPFFLENLSYKFDVLPMTLATVLAGIAVTAIAPAPRRVVLGALALLATLCLYQPALNVFLVFTIAEFVMGQRDLLPPRRLAGALAARAAQLLLALVAYKGVIAVTVNGHYATAHGAIAPMGALPATVWHNLLSFWRYVTGLLPGLWSKPLLVCIAAGALASVYWALRYLVMGWRAAPAATRLGMAACAVLLPPALAIAAWGPMLALELPVYAPRVAIGFGALGAASLLFAWAAMQRVRVKPSWQVAALAVPVYGLFTFCFVYGNSLKLQKDYENRVAAQIATDLSRIAAGHAIAAYTLEGSLGHAVVVRHTLRKYPLIGALVPVHLTEGWGWAYEELQHFGVDLPYRLTAPQMPRVVPGTTAAPGAGGPAVAVARDYRIYLEGDMAVVAFLPSS